ncbi:reverse transcriptase domain-containing protein, partial [Tanacetum coccineum]
CIDYRKLNEATRKDHFPLPFMDQMLERLAGNEYYCFLDGFSGYFQIPIDPRDQEKTTFTCPYGTFAYRRMPFGLCNAPGTFQRCMLAIFHDMVEKTMEVFMDDFSVFGNSFQNCLSRLDHMLQRCEDTNLSLNWEKSHFMVKEGIVLGHKISKKGIEVDKAKIDVIAKLPHPTTVKGIRSFLGHAGFYRRFIQDFSKISRPMTHLLEKNTPFIFSDDCIRAFQTLKDRLTEAPILIAPNWDLPFELMCDASDFAIAELPCSTQYFEANRRKEYMTNVILRKTLIKAEHDNYIYQWPLKHDSPQQTSQRTPMRPQLSFGTIHPPMSSGNQDGAYPPSRQLSSQTMGSVSNMANSPMDMQGVNKSSCTIFKAMLNTLWQYDTSKMLQIKQKQNNVAHDDAQLMIFYGRNLQPCSASASCTRFTTSAVSFRGG